VGQTLSVPPSPRSARRASVAAQFSALAVGVVTVLGVAFAAPVGMIGAAGAGGTASSPSFAAVDSAMRARLRDQHGGAVLVVHDRTTMHRRTFQGLRGTTRLPVASASKWLTAATLMTLVDQGRVGLDDPVARYLPSFRGEKGTITIRSLLSHTSGLPDLDCEGDPTTTLAACAESAAQLTANATPGRTFRYSGVGYEIAAHIIEAVTGEPFERAFQDRIAQPVGMKRTHFDEIDGQQTENPNPAASAISTLDDYARFLDMLLHLGVSGSQRVLSSGAVLEIERDQVQGLDTRSDAAVQITRIPTYGLGVWRDVTGLMDESIVVSGSGALGFYPWIDRAHDNFGIVAVDDERGSDVAVPASQRVAKLAWTTAATPIQTTGTHRSSLLRSRPVRSARTTYVSGAAAR
jgi:serine-type D-Ala-D-Ala carboxypeptidase/endopeptidase